jgi:hypothetical protein
LWEIVASKIVASALRATVVPRDFPGAPPETHDFDLLLNGGRVAALEVSTSARPEELSLWSAIAKQRWEAPSLRESWSLSVFIPGDGAQPSIRALRRRAVALLERLESPGVGDFDATEWHPPTAPGPAPTLDALLALDVKRGRAVGTPNAPPP